MKVVLAGSSDVLSGDAVEIVRAMQSRAFGVDHLTIAEYVAWLAEQMQRRSGVELEIVGAVDAELASSLIEALCCHGLARHAA